MYRFRVKPTYAPLEILVVDDCSEDNTVELVGSVSDERVRVIINQAILGSLATGTNVCGSRKGIS